MPCSALKYCIGLVVLLLHAAPCQLVSTAQCLNCEYFRGKRQVSPPAPRPTPTPPPPTPNTVVAWDAACPTLDRASSSTSTSGSNSDSLNNPHPCDIAIVAGLGDSISVAANADSSFLQSAAVPEWPGLAFSVGGDTGFPTIPTLLQDSCGTLPYGASFGTTWGSDSAFNLNVAESGAKAEDVPEQADALVATLKATRSQASYDADWKLVTILVGGNNLCIVCNSNAADQANGAAMYEQHLSTTFATLATLPRTVVNVPLHPDYTQLAEIDWGFFGNIACGTILEVICPCLGGGLTSEASKQKARDTIKEYNEVLEKLVGEFNSPDYTGTRGDGTRFIVQPFAENSAFNNKALVAEDCFHPNKKGHELLALGLWNNMMQASASKADVITPTSDKICPSVSAMLS